MLITIKKSDLPTALKAIELGIDIILEKEQQDGYLVSGEPQSLYNLGVVVGFENLKKETYGTQKES